MLLLLYLSTPFTLFNNFLQIQARCQVGREQVFSWGRRKRGVGSPRTSRGHAQETTKEQALAEAQARTATTTDGDEMSISQEILVLDLGDDQSPQYRYDPTADVPTSHQTNHHNRK